MDLWGLVGDPSDPSDPMGSMGSMVPGLVMMVMGVPMLEAAWFMENIIELDDGKILTGKPYI